MTSDIDIYRTANILIREHGRDAPIQAAMCADAMLERCDLDGQPALAQAPCRRHRATKPAR